MANAQAVEMEKELYNAAMRGTVDFLPGRSDEYLLRKTRQNRNVMHIAIRYEQLELVRVLLEKFPNNYKLITDQEISNKNTPFHVAAELGNLEIMSILYDYSVEVELREGDEKPWMLRNSKGNTVVHVALIHDNVKVARFLLEKDLDLASIVNESKEAPLHIAIKQHVNYFESQSMITKIKEPIHKGGAGLAFRYEAEEDMSSMIHLLVEIASSVASWPDSKGLTPLLRAASLSTPYNMRITKLLIQHCPQSTEVCDSNGKSILHLLINKIPTYQDVANMLCMKEIYALKNHQDHTGNTPLHIAAKNKDISMVRVLLENNPKLNINNSDGVSGLSLIQQHNVFQMLRQRKMTAEESRAAERADIRVLQDRINKLGLHFLHSRDSTGMNLLHKLMPMKIESRISPAYLVVFMQQILQLFSGLVSQTDKNGNTPVHILVQNNCDTEMNVDSQNFTGTNQTNNDTSGKTMLLSLKLLEICKKCIVNSQQQAIDYENPYDLPWLVKNEDGNTPLHDAVMAKNNDLVLKLLEYNKTAASIANKHKKTPLHLLVQSDEMGALKETIEKMVEANREAACCPDEDGLTPILRAIKADNPSSAAMLCELSPEAAAIGDRDGNTFWHLLINHPSHYFVYYLLHNKALRGVLEKGDNEEGNTPLHVAMKDRRFDIVQDFFDIWERERDALPAKHNQGRHQCRWLMDLLQIPNKAGKTLGDLIAEETCLPYKIEKRIKHKHEMVGVRSVWGIPTTQTENYVNSMGIIAALLATMTFTVAFAVPGGLFEDIGTPIMIKKVAFQVFMITDVVALCLSMMVLVCLLTIVATNSKRTSVVILDFSINLLIASFCVTTVTFMMGMFAAMSSVKPWIAILTVVLCSLLILLAIGFFLMIKLLIPINECALYLPWMLGKAITKFFNTKKSEEKARGQGGVRQSTGSENNV